MAAQRVGKNVVTSERARAELMVHAPAGVEPGKPDAILGRHKSTQTVCGLTRSRSTCIANAVADEALPSRLLA